MGTLHLRQKNGIKIIEEVLGVRSRRLGGWRTALRRSRRGLRELAREDRSWGFAGFLVSFSGFLEGVRGFLRWERKERN